MFNGYGNFPTKKSSKGKKITRTGTRGVNGRNTQRRNSITQRGSGMTQKNAKSMQRQMDAAQNAQLYAIDQGSMQTNALAMAGR